MRKPIFLAILTLIGPAAAWAGDGQIDLRIDPATGATIDQPGSYVVVENVTMTADVPAITVTVEDVSIDLGGHVIRGLAGGTTDGISAAGIDYLKVVNGRIRGFGDDGIQAQDDGHFENLAVIGCGKWGINVRHRGVFMKIQARGNNTAGDAGGIQGEDYCAASDCMIAENSPLAAGSVSALRFNSHNRVERNTVTTHAATTSYAVGIYTQNGGTIIGNTVRGVTSTNQQGIVLGIRNVGDAVIQSNHVEQVSGYNTTIGLDSGAKSVIEANTISYVYNYGGNPLVGMSAGFESIIRANTVASVFHQGSGSATGISAGGSCTIINNTTSFVREGLDSASTAIGISTSIGCVIIGNTCNGNSGFGTNGSGRGIKASTNCLIQDNTCDENDATGSGNAYGIEVTGSCRVQGNHVTNSTGGTASYGIRASSSGNVIIGNTCANNGTAGVLFSSATNNRSESNRFRQAIGIDTTNGASPASLGAGTLADVTH